VAIEQAVYDMIVEGEKKGIWRYKKPVPAVVKEEPKVEVKVEEVKVEPKVEVKVEEKKDVVVQPQTKSETKTEAVPSTAAEVKKEQPRDPVDLFGTRVLKEDAYVYKEADEKSQRTWLLKKGTELTIISPGPEGWHLVRDAEKRKGYVKQDVLTNKPQ
jgi:SH3-like domain-containing protein